MKKRILAALVAVAMAVTVFASLTASAAEPVKADDFEGTQVVGLKEWWGTPGENSIAEEMGPNGTMTKVWKVVNTGWGVGNMGTVLSDLDTTKTYKLSVWVKGDWAYLDLQNPAVADNPETKDVNESSFDKLSTLGADWKLVETTFTGVANVNMVFQIQSAQGYYNGTAYMDDFMVVEYDPSAVEPTPAVDEPSATAGTEATKAPVVEGTPAATTAPTAVVGTPAPTTAPTVTPTSTTKPPKKVTIKFKKKSVKIKKGKKVTLKVTLKNAKKANFSVDKKGKKVVKLSKKKAKSVVVTGKKKGKATITAKAGNKKATCKVKVK